MTRSPWLKFYPSDWRGDPLLRGCAPLTRYVWFELLLLMHEAVPYGHLLIAGRAPEATTLARVIGVDVGDVKRAVRELTESGVLSRTESGVVYSRRMIRDENRRKNAANNGAKGGNPALKNQYDNGPWDNPPDKGEDKAQIPIPETSNQRFPPKPPKGGGRGRSSISKGGYAAAGRALAAIGDAPEQPQEGFDDRKRA